MIGQQVNGNPQFRTLIGDHIGSVRAEMFGSTVMAIRTYGPYGEVIAEVGDIETAYGYTGELYDSTTGHLYLRARYYDPSSMMFMARDPYAGDEMRPATYNLYIYSLNNPVNYTDPSGEIAILAIIAQVGAEMSIDALFQVVIGYYFEPEINTWSDAFFNIDLNQLLWSGASGLVPGGRLTRAAVIAAGDVILNYMDDCENYGFADAGRDFAIGIGSELIGEYAGELIAKHGIDLVRNGFRNMELGIDIDAALQRFLGGNGSSSGNGSSTGNGSNSNYPSGGCLLPGHSFSEDTLVWTDEGALSINKITLGEMVYAYNEETDEIGLYPVTDYFIHEDPVIVYLTIDGELIETTPEHPFYTAEGAWVDAGDLLPGDQIRTRDWTLGTVESTEMIEQSQLMYNFTVDIAHTYFVGDGELLVHNCGGKFFGFKFDNLRGKSLKYIKRNKPSGWQTKPTDNGQGWKWLDENGVERFRFMRPNGQSPASSQWSRDANGRFRWTNAQGEFLDIDGNVISRSHPNFQELTHIMYEGIYP